MVNLRSIYVLIAGIGAYFCGAILRAIEITASKFEVCLDYAVKAVISEARSVQRAAPLFVAKISESGGSLDCRGFASLRRSLDASAIA